MKQVLIWVVVAVALWAAVLEYQHRAAMKRIHQREAEAQEEYVRCAANAIANGVMNYEVICSK